MPLDTACPKPLPREKKVRKAIARTKRPRAERPAKPKRPTLRQLDDLARPLCRNRPEECEAASYLMHGPAKGCSPLKQWCHILSRGYKTSVRWSMTNCLKMCSAHHAYFTPRPIEWRRFLIWKIGESNLYDLEQRALRELREKSDRLAVKENLLSLSATTTNVPNVLVIHS